MSSVGASFRQVDANFVNLDDLTDFIYTEASVKGALNAGNDPVPVGWDQTALAGTAGTVFLKDLGKSLMGGGLVFRKVQLVGVDPATSGVSGDATATEPFLTGYILLGLNGASGALTGGWVAPVAKY